MKNGNKTKNEGTNEAFIFYDFFSFIIRIIKTLKLF